MEGINRLLLAVRESRLYEVNAAVGSTEGTFCCSTSYCRARIEIVAIFDLEHPTVAPDIIPPIGSGSLMRLPDIPSLVLWNHEDPLSLLNVLNDVMLIFKAYKKGEVWGWPNSRVKFELETLEGRGMELLLRQGGGGGAEVHALVDLQVDLSSFGPIVPPKPLMLCLEFRLGANDNVDSINVDVEYPSGLERQFAKLKVMPLSVDSCLAIYIPTLEEMLNQHVSLLSANNAQRREAVVELLRVFPNTCLEFDADHYAYCSCIFDVEKFFFIAHFTFPADYPLSKPSITLQSLVYANSKGTPTKRAYNNFPYAPTMSPKDIVTGMRPYLMESCKNFHRFCEEQNLLV